MAMRVPLLTKDIPCWTSYRLLSSSAVMSDALILMCSGSIFGTTPSGAPLGWTLEMAAMSRAELPPFSLSVGLLREVDK